MDASLLAVLNDAERLLVGETAAPALADLDEDAVVALHARVRRARSKYVSQYRRQAAARVPEQGARGGARHKNTRARQKAEVFEEALSRVSTQLGLLAAQAAADLKTERLAAAQAGKGGGPGASGAREGTSNDPSVSGANR